MQIDIKVTVTPQELRSFLGLPDVEPLQRELLEQAREMMLAGPNAVDPLNVMKPFITPNLQGMEAMQRAFFKAFTQAASASSASANHAPGHRGPPDDSAG